MSKLLGCKTVPVTSFVCYLCSDVTALKYFGIVKKYVLNEHLLMSHYIDFPVYVLLYLHFELNNSVLEV